MTIDHRTRRDDAAREELLAQLAQSRAEIHRVLEPPPAEPSAGPSGEPSEARSQLDAAGFPRSRTLRMLMSGRGLGGVVALLGGFLIARPALAWRLVRLLRSSAVARMLMLRAIAALRAKRG
jgi:hypothetical protein